MGIEFREGSLSITPTCDAIGELFILFFGFFFFKIINFLAKLTTAYFKKSYGRDFIIESNYAVIFIYVDL